MSQHGIYPVKNPTDFLLNDIEYKQMYQESIEQPDTFWARQAQRIDWMTPFTKVKNTQYSPNVSIKWFEDGELNVCYNCVDRHLAENADKVAIIWEGDETDQSKNITFKQLHQEVCRFANILDDMGVKKGDVVTIYMPMVPEAAYAMLACARVGAIHSVVFGGFSPESLAGRIEGCESKFIITANEGVRGGKTIPLKLSVDLAIDKVPHDIEKVLVINRTTTDVAMEQGRDLDYGALRLQVSDEHEAVKMNAEDPLFILYTSGSTGKPKGVLHTTGGYIVYASLTHQYIFDCRPDDVYWCTADVGWITGHTYMIYGPLANGITTLLFESVPTYPDASRCWQVVDKHNVSIFYTAPTAIRALMRFGDEFLNTTNRSSLRILGSVGEPINPEAWEWYYEKVGHSNCPVVDTWWQTETGGVLITPLPGATTLKPGSATRPFFGVQPALVDEKGEALEGEAEGALVMLDSWPGQMRTVYGDHDRFEQTYFSQFPGKYFSGDGAKRDEDGYYWVTGRMDDVLNVSGHRLGTAEVESAIDEHPQVVESAVVGFPHDVKGQGIYAFVTLLDGVEPSEELKIEITRCVRSEIGGIASPDTIQWAPGLPKTRSGKIMRRILRKIANDDVENIGDTSTLADPSVVDGLVAHKIEVSG